MFGSILKSSLLSLALAGLFVGCGHDDDKIPAEFELSVTNMTNFQPLSPVGVVLHDSASFFTLGEKASVDLEKMAESGDNSGLLALGKTSTSTAGVLLPGETATLMITRKYDEMKLSVGTMLVNTNDAFTGVDAYAISAMKVGETVVFNTNAYDAGTEANSEAAGTIPGPADGGEGFNATRDDVDLVRMHAGVVTKDDGLSSSVLTEQAKFDNAVMRVSLKRIK